MHLNVHCSTVYNSQDMEATLMSIDGGMDKDDVCVCVCTEWNIVQPLKRMK